MTNVLKINTTSEKLDILESMMNPEYKYDLQLVWS